MVATAASPPALPKPRPLLKWAGGKTKLLPELEKRLPREVGAYFEPFLGGGALFFHLHNAGRLHGSPVTLNDANGDLIRCYRAVRDATDAVLHVLRSLRNTEEYFQRIRCEWDPGSISDAEAAARTIFLNKTCFNGLYRVNRAGIFNVPYGDNARANFCDEPNLRACAAAFARTDLFCFDFEEIGERARRGDLVYFDCPYYPTSKTSSFTAYTAGGFTDADHVRLRDLAVRLKERGVHVILSNADVPRVRELYSERYFKVERVEAARSVNSKGTGRGKVGEVIVT